MTESTAPIDPKDPSYPHAVTIPPEPIEEGQPAIATDEPQTVVDGGVQDVRSTSLAVIAILASLYALHWAQNVFIPLLVALLLTYALAPLVHRLTLWHVPRWIAAGLIVFGLGAGVSGTVYSLGDNAIAMVNSLPIAARKLGQSISQKRYDGPSPIEKVQDAAEALEKATADKKAVRRPGITRVQVERAPFNVRDYLWSGTVGLLTFGSQFTIVVFLTFFALGSGDAFRRKLVRMAGPTLHRRKVTIQVLDEVTGQIQRYLMVQLLASVVVGLATWLALWAIGLDNAAVWGIVGGALTMIPYLGSVLFMAGAGLAAVSQFGQIDQALLVAAMSLGIHALVGNLLVPWLTSRANKMNALAVFVCVLFWGWLWGAWGLLLGIPIMMVVKSICDRIEEFAVVSELLGE